jgi:uncharacterized protein involved in exopolysaccharide biosynthesis
MNVRNPYQGFPPPAGAPNPATGVEPSAREKIARFKTLSRRAFRYWKLTFVILILGMAASLAVALTVKLTYRSECTVLYRNTMRPGERDDELSPERARQIGAKLKDMLTTRSRLEALIEEYNLYPKIVAAKGVVEAVEEMRLHIGFRARDSQTYVISFETEVPQVARDVTKSLADSMIADFTSTATNTAKQEADFLAKQEEAGAANLENANKALATFLTLHPEFAVEGKTAFGPGGGGGAGVAVAATANAQTHDPQLAVLYRQKARLEAELRNNDVPEGRAAPPANESIAKLTQLRDEAAKSVAAAQADLADKRTRLTDAHPDVVSAKVTADAAARRLHQAEVLLANARAPGAAPAQDSNEGAGADADEHKRIAQIDAQIAARQSAVRRAPQVAGTDAGAAQAGETNELVQLETEWQRLLSVLHDERVEHDDLKLRLERARLAANAAEATGGDQMTVIDPAYKPLSPSKGGRTKTALAGGLMTIILALCYAFARVLTNDTLFDAADVEALRMIPVLGVVPKVRASAPPAAVRKESARVG